MKKPIRKKTVSAILLAAGNSQRMGHGLKQFSKLKGRPLIFYSIDKLLSSPQVNKLIIAVPKTKIKYTSRLIFGKYSPKKIEIIAGGFSRRRSCLLALEHLNKKTETSDYVIFHDAARPLISKKIITRVFNEAEAHGAAVVGKSAIDLIFSTKNNFVKRAIRKDSICYGYTPQCFRFNDILEAHLKFKKNNSFETADNVELLLGYDKNIKVKIIDIFYPNLKMTYREDIKMIEPFL